MLMTSVLGNQQGDQEVLYVERTSDRCDGPDESKITSAAECGAGAVTISMSDYPSGCFYYSGSLYLNTDNNPDIACSSSAKCLCTLTCPPGTYQDEVGQTSCKTCADGEYRSEGACKTCEFGTYGEGECPCPNGNPGNGNHCENPYLPCSIGQYDNGVCENCPVGKYQDQVGQGSCKTCGFGRYQDQEGMSECKTCDGDCGGWEVIEVTTGTCDYSLSSSTECESALAILGGNYYVVVDNSLRPTGCYKSWSGSGYFNKANTEVTCDIYSCICTTMATCVPGKYRDQTDNSCKSCASGRYQHQYNQVSCIDGSICQSGTYLNNTSDNSCTVCPNGYYQDEDGQERCTKCPAGRYQDESAKSDCKTCARGWYQDKEGMTACKELTEASYLVLKTDTCDDVASRVSSELCQEAYDSTFGMYGAQPVNTVSTLVLPSGCSVVFTDDRLELYFNTRSTNKKCDAGITLEGQPTVLQCICSACAPGTVGTGCASCAGGQYQSEYAQSSCASCPAGFYHDEEGQTDCKVCDGSKEGANTCVELSEVPVDIVKEAYVRKTSVC